MKQKNGPLSRIATKMDQATHSKIVSFLWGIADDVLRDLFKRGKYEISFTRYFYQPKPLRTLEEIRADIIAVQKEAEGLLDERVQGASK